MSTALKRETLEAAKRAPETQPAVEIPPVPPTPIEDDIEKLLGVGVRRPFLRRHPWLSSFAVLALALTGYGAWALTRPATPPTYVLQPSKIGDLTVTVTATGRLQPTNQVEISSELSGVVDKVFVDYNDRVEKGQLLASLKTDRLEAQITRSRALLSVAKSKLAEAEITRQEKRQDLERMTTLGGRGVMSEKDVLAAKAASARADMQVESARADIAVAEADLRVREADLASANITSPIGGVVLTRSVESGQTVASSFQAPILFKLAEDLKQMEAEVDIDEADVGKVAVGQTASFTVDAYPDRRFPASIREISFASAVVQGVVTYKALLTVDNSALLLRPGMTATAEVKVEEIKQALLVPNGALRFEPPADDAADKGPTFLQSILQRFPRFREASKPEPKGNARQVYVLKDGKPSGVAVVVGATDGKLTVIKSGALPAGVEVITDTKSGSRR